MGQKRKAADLLDWLGIRDPPDWLLSRWLGAGIGCILILAALILFPFAILAAVLVVYATASLALSGLGDGPNLGAGALIAAILGAPFLIWATMIKQRALGFQKEGHITDRISKAVEMLGAEKTVKLRGNDEDDNDITIEETRPNIEVRIGGILSLERIAQDSCAYDKGRDHVRVMEILCAYVRENSRANSLASTPTPFVPKKPRLDIQKAVDGIKRRSAAQLQIETVAEYRLDLRETDLDGCDLSKGSFVGAIFWRSRLESTNFTKTDLTAARFQGCLLNFTLFEETLLRGTNLDFAILSETGFGYFARAKLDSLFVEGAQMQGLHINEANCRKIFGSSDTTVASSLESDKVFGLHAANMTYLSETTDNEASIEDHHGVVSEKAKYFLHWNPYTAYDMASEHFRRKFREERGLVGWPFQD